MPDLLCVRCGERREALAAPPMGGELGQKIFSGICARCWNDWREESARLINHYGLSLGAPAHRERLRTEMKEFLRLVPRDRDAESPAQAG